MQNFGSNLSTKTIQKIYFVGFAVLVLTLFYYQILKGTYYQQRAKNNYVRLIPLPAIRGNILDRHGNLLAYDRATFNISVVPHQIRNKKDALFKKIAEFLNYKVISIKKKYKRNLRSFFTPVDIVTDIDRNLALKLKEEFQDSVLINPRPQRYYPYSYEFAHLLGYVKKAESHYEKLKKYGYHPLERIGFMGIEQHYDAYLKGEDGGDLIEVDVKGKMVGFLGQLTPQKGKNIYLTVDKQIQDIAFEMMAEKKGTILLMNSHNGEIIALYSSPSFDSNNFIKGKNIAKFLINKNSPLINRALQATYPIGSIFKPILGIAALNQKKLKSSKTFNCTGKFNLGDALFRCWSIHGTNDFSQAMGHSCNIYFYNLGLMLGPNSISKWAKKFGLDSTTNIDLPYERKGFVPSPSWKRKKRGTNWFAGDTLNFSIGQGFMNTTPLEIMVALNAFANNGYLITPHILKEVDNVPSGSSTTTYLDIDDNNLQIMKKALGETVRSKGGTAHILDNLNLGIFGKTGTAQTRGESHGWFVGSFPYKENTYTICVFLENAGSSYEAVKLTYFFLKKIKEKNLL